MAETSSKAVVGPKGQNDRAAVDISKVRAEEQKIAFANCEDNVLKSYSNVTYRWTLAPLKPNEVSGLTAGENIIPSNIVIQSGGGSDASRASTFYGQPEYFIDNVEINTLATPTKISGLSGNCSINFDVIEPYSLGLFIQSLQSAAERSGYSNYLECTWLMKVEFLGNDVSGTQRVIPEATRLYTQLILGVSFVANEAGSKYQVKTLDFNLSAFNNIYGGYQGSANIEGSTVAEALASLAKVLNDDQQTAKKNKLIEIADEYEIIVERDNNKISQSKFAGAESSEKPSGSNQTTQKGDTKDRSAPVTGARRFTFPKPAKGNRRIPDMISEIMIASEFCTKATLSENVDKNTGYVTWYRISAKTEYLGGKYKLDGIQNRPAYKITYVVTPYSVHHSVMKTPLADSLGFQPNQILSTIKKQYNYLYTGLNDDIIRWELKFDNTFYTSALTNITATNKDSSAGITETPARSNQPPSAGKANTITHRGRLLRDTAGSYVKPIGGGTYDTPDIRIARAFEQSILLDTEMITLSLTILGDPYYLTRSGAFLDKIGPATEGAQINNDKTMATESGEVRIFLRFRTPIDAPKPGEALFIFPSSGYADSPFGGLYKIRSVKSKFYEGVFTQDLDLFRDRGQQPEEIQNIRSDPSIIFGSALTVDPRVESYGAVSNEDTPTNSDVVVTPLPNQGAVIEVNALPPIEMEITRNGKPIPDAPGTEFNKTGPLGNKLPYTEDLEKQLQNNQ